MTNNILESRQRSTGQLIDLNRNSQAIALSS